MSEFSGTPGPWLIDRYGKVVDGRGMTVGVSGVALPMTRDAECVANAHLVSAAPEILESLQQMVSAAYRLGLVYDDDTWLSLEVSKAEYTINKALGR